jgi:GTP-binding protein Era
MKTNSNASNANSGVKRCGTIALVGRPNVGKSTLLNTMVGEKITITSEKAQTTRNSIRGIKTSGNDQFIYVDTPGLHKNKETLMQKAMIRDAFAQLYDVDIVVVVIEATRWQQEDDWVIECLAQVTSPVILVINKVDRLKNKEYLLPLLGKYQALYPFVAMIPLSAKKSDNVIALEKEIAKLLPEHEHVFDGEQLTDKSEEFYIAELIREQLFQQLYREVPYSVGVQVELLEEGDTLNKIHAAIVVAREGQKKIVIGRQGEQLKAVGQAVRLYLEEFYGKKVFLKLWVKVEPDWFNESNLLRELGFDN